MVPTALVYSSHSRSHVLHHDLIVRRALAGKSNRRILLLPMSMAPRDGDERANQHTEAENFGWYFRQFESAGLEWVPFFWSSGLRAEDVDLLWQSLEESEVVLLAGGSSPLGLRRYRALGAQFNQDAGTFERILRTRQDRGLLTVGFSAGADQLMERLFRSTHDASEDYRAFGLVHATFVTLHHDPSRNAELIEAARRFPSARVFGLPNDSGLLVSRGTTRSGASWQLTQFIVDQSWDRPQDTWHIRTRAGANIEHFYPDGRHWGFRQGDWMLRARKAGASQDELWMGSGGRTLEYRSQQSVGPVSVETLLARLDG